MVSPYSITLLVILGVLTVGVYGGGGEDDEDDEEDLGFGSALSDAFARVKTREIERLLRTAWCVVKGPSCASRVKRGLHTSTSGSESNHEVNIEAALNRFSQCICRTYSVGAECKLYVPLSLHHNHHINAQTSFSLVFYWLEVVKDFYCYISIDSVITCDFSQKLSVPTTSRTEIQNFVKHIQGDITQKSECSEFCSRFRCIYESWGDQGLTTPFNEVYQKCVQQMCMTTPSPRTTGRAAIATNRHSIADVTRAPIPHVTRAPQETAYVNHTMILPRNDFKPDAAEQDGADIGSRDTSTLVGGLVGGLLALSLLAFIMFIIVFWRRKRKHNQEKREVPPITFVSPGQTHIDNDATRPYTEQRNRPAITAVNPLASGCLNGTTGNHNDVITLTSRKRGSLDDTYATLTETQMSGHHDNPAYELDMSLNKGEELVLAQRTSNSLDHVIEGIYAKPVDSSRDTNEMCDDQYLEPVQEGVRYVAYPQQNLKPVSGNDNTEDYLEPVPVENGYVASGPSYMRMESAASNKSTRQEAVTEDTQYVSIDCPEPNYYNM